MQRVSNYCQFAYTAVQEHAVWRNADFWELLFYQDAQRDLQRFYLEERARVRTSASSVCTSGGGGSGGWKESASACGMLELMAEQLGEQARAGAGADEAPRARLAGIEEEQLISRANHFVTLVINFRVPLDVDKFHYSSEEHGRFKERNDVASHARHAGLLSYSSQLLVHYYELQIQTTVFVQ